MAAEDIRHFRVIGRAAGGGDYFSGFSEVCGAHYRRGYDDELFHILIAEIIEAVQRRPGGCTAPARDQPRWACRQPSR